MSMGHVIRQWCGGLMFSIAVIASTASASHAADEKPATASEVLQLIKLIKADSLGIQMGTAMGTAVVDGMRTQWPDMPDTVVAIAREEVRRTMEEGMTELMPEMVAIYVRYYSSSDIQALIGFYGSPVGQKVLRTMPALMQECVQAGQAWGVKRQAVIVERLQQRIERWKQGLPAEPARKD